MKRCISVATILISLLATQAVSFAATPTWTEIKTSHFIVVSNASEHDTRRVAEQFEMIRAVFVDYFGKPARVIRP